MKSQLHAATSLSFQQLVDLLFVYRPLFSYDWQIPGTSTSRKYLVEVLVRIQVLVPVEVIVLRTCTGTSTTLCGATSTSTSTVPVDTTI